ncbi:GlcG/HbpS family heme-binding protein [Roseibium sediminicola]|uniref:Heme-binding protein n=1 Tax=Roseibium sediminicola TaxID=2933272 RepID=A0ABT0H2U8_9HYPH|nr:heme-binding protein [Roseibium sp. CAU 1639]MCK7615795.1 heme-binding protein [Roseibium sp. CAU 1639]
MGRALLILAFVLLPAPSFSQAAATHTVEVLDLQLAMRAALRAIEVCNEAGFQAGASVVDRFGVEQVTLRNNMGGALVAEAARRKAQTAASFNQPTATLEPQEAGGGDAGLGAIPGVVPLGGGLPIVTASGALLGGIGVAGGGGSENEAKCAKAGLDAIADQLK